jgi:ATP-dependent DNA helicase RecG
MSAEEVSSVLGKTSQYVANKYLYPMVRDGVLGHLYPEMVKHPGQKYVVNRKAGE